MKQVTETLARFEQKETFLKNNFEVALKDKLVLEFVNQLNCPHEILRKYTSLLEESAVEFSHCKDCPGLMACQNKMTGYAYLPQIYSDHLEFHYQSCRYQRMKQKEDIYKKYMLLSHESPSITEARMDLVYLEQKERLPIVQKLDDFIEHYQQNPHQKGLYLHGSFGCGKTYMITAMFHTMALRKVRSMIVFWPECLRELKSSFQDDFKAKYERIKRMPLLLIDDIGAENTTAWGRDEILGPLLQYRMNEQLPTFFTSNLDLKSLEQHFSVTKEQVDIMKARRIMERIVHMCDVQCLISKDLRQ